MHRASALHARVADLKEAGLRFRNEMKVGPGGKQIQTEEPDAYPLELFEVARGCRLFPSCGHSPESNRQRSLNHILLRIFPEYAAPGKTV